MQWAKQKYGFTIVELLIVIVVIAILAAITIVAYNGIQTQARDSKIKSDLANIEKAVMVARNNTGLTFREITGTGYTASPCVTLPAGTDLAALDSSHACWTRYTASLGAISDESGINVRGTVDPWGRPYFIDENEGENGNCSLDYMAAYTLPTNGTARMSHTITQIPLSGNSGC